MLHVRRVTVLGGMSAIFAQGSTNCIRTSPRVEIIVFGARRTSTRNGLGEDTWNLQSLQETTYLSRSQARRIPEETTRPDTEEFLGSCRMDSETRAIHRSLWLLWGCL